MIMSDVLYEIPPLSERDCFYIVERHKNRFTYPIHKHKEFELNFVQGGKGARRIVGDSIEEIGDFDLVLIGEENLEHVWEQGSCESSDIKEITIQFMPDVFSPAILVKNQFATIARMLDKAKHGLCFPLEAIMKVYDSLCGITQTNDSFSQYLSMMRILYELSRFDARELTSGSFVSVDKSSESRRVKTVKQYIVDHYSEPLTLDELASLIGMSPSSFSRFFRRRTGKTLIDYISDIRLGMAARSLVDSTKNISEICYACGYNNLANFNRAFKSKKGMTPKEFRALYKKEKIIV